MKGYLQDSKHIYGPWGRISIHEPKLRMRGAISRPLLISSWHSA